MFTIVLTSLALLVRLNVAGIDPPSEKKNTFVSCQSYKNPNSDLINSNQISVFKNRVVSVTILDTVFYKCFVDEGWSHIPSSPSRI